MQLHRSRRTLVCALVTLAALAAAGARAQTAQPALMPPIHGVLNLTATATVEVARDLITVTMAATRDGADAGTVQAQLKQAVDVALTEARKAARPGQVDVRTGHFSIHPRYTNKGQIGGWVGTGEVVLEGKDIPAIAQLAGRLPTVTVSRVNYALSREAREKVEAEVTGQAIARYRARAAEVSKQFGYGSYTIREINVATDDAVPPPVPMMAMRAKAEAADAALPVEPGRGTVTATVSGSVQMK